MNAYLLDTNVIATIAPRMRRSPAEENVRKWLETYAGELWLSVVTAAEVADGIAKANRTGATRKARDLAEWWAEVEHYYGPRILPLDLDIAHVAGQLLDVARAAGETPGFEDIAIAATAKHRGMTVLTGNARHFSPLDVSWLDPFERLPDSNQLEP